MKMTLKFYAGNHNNFDYSFKLIFKLISYYSKYFLSYKHFSR